MRTGLSGYSVAAVANDEKNPAEVNATKARVAKLTSCRFMSFSTDLIAPDLKHINSLN
jgi:hypothetical protein